MPAKTERQRQFMGAELERRRRGKRTRTRMSTAELERMASKPGHNTPGDGTGLDAERVPSIQAHELCGK